MMQHLSLNDPSFIKFRDEAGNTCVHHAAKYGNLSVFKLK